MSPEGTKEVTIGRTRDCRSRLSSLRDFLYYYPRRYQGLASLAKSFCPFGALLFLVIASSGLAQTAPAVDTPSYWNKAWRDSVAEYRGRVEAYHQLFYSYDWGITFAMLPVAGEWYVDKTMTGVRFSIARVV